MKGIRISSKEFEYSVEKEMRISLSNYGHRFRQNPDLYPPTLVPNSTLIVKLPRKFRELRALLFASWYFPEVLKFLIQGEIGTKEFFFNFTLEQNLEIRMFSISKEISLEYLYYLSELDAREFFGTVLRDDLESALKSLRIYWKSPKKPRKKVRRKGYRDQGSRKPDDKWSEKFDFSFTERQNQKEILLESFQLTYQSLLIVLESRRSEN